MSNARIADSWTYAGKDVCGQFFTTALRAANPPVSPAARTLEIGCAEFDWLRFARESWPEMVLTGIDWRARKHTPAKTSVIQGDVMTQPFPAASFEWIVGVSTFEHIGLGHYDRDPVNADGDVRTLDLCWNWLAPGGWLYFDVPWNDRYEVVGTSHRVYDDAAIETRCKQAHPWREHWRGHATKSHTHTLVTTTPPLKGGESFYYIGLWWQKPEN